VYKVVKVNTLCSGFDVDMFTLYFQSILTVWKTHFPGGNVVKN